MKWCYLDFASACFSSFSVFFFYFWSFNQPPRAKNKNDERLRPKGEPCCYLRNFKALPTQTHTRPLCPDMPTLADAVQRGKREVHTYLWNTSWSLQENTWTTLSLDGVEHSVCCHWGACRASLVRRGRDSLRHGAEGHDHPVR